MSKTASQVRNGQRWIVEAVDTARQTILARRIGDDAVAILGGDYLREHVHHGYAVTLQSEQGDTGQTAYPIVSARTDRKSLYTGLTRGREMNRVFIYDKIAGEGDHEHAEPAPVYTRPAAVTATRLPNSCAPSPAATTGPKPSTKSPRQPTAAGFPTG
ncbi:putative relaxase domain protein [Mycobacterium kansasii]|uniref:Putative relaxase domain protein n=1 Tax=Mycobacterium kansasii TaxID=1768 RepID=A0A1V3XTI8_MYCKA|nr:putative relaxase domain protein [Mycobacterium kansasii]